ncbi:MAG: hypothetical protein HY903_17650 [Deltaproteobacteria bacterium]|nr:hypothetical protein [Deltaproteobacteria bacterium]
MGPTPHARREFRVVSTVGPQSLTPEFLRLTLELGQPFLRLNASHLEPAALTHHLEVIGRTSAELQVSLDLQGGKRRIGVLQEPLVLVGGKAVTVALGPVAPRGDLPLPDPELFAAAQAGDVLVLADGQVRLRVVAAHRGHLQTEVEKGTSVRSQAGVHLEGRALPGCRLDPVQAAQLALARQHAVPCLALSYVEAAADVEALCAYTTALDYRPRIAAKIERPNAVAAVAGIAAVADEVWLCRGDLGALVPLRDLGRIQAEVIAAAAGSRVPCLVAGQVFQHLTFHAEPTRSEVVHLHDIRARGVAGVVLSDETAVGVDPQRALRQVVGLL